jgi:hypothetical protein
MNKQRKQSMREVRDAATSELRKTSPTFERARVASGGSANVQFFRGARVKQK